MHVSLRPQLGELLNPEPELVQKANAYGINQYTKGSGSGDKASGKVAVAGVFSKSKKPTIQDATEALAKQGIKLEHAGMVDHRATYKLTSKDGSTATVGGKELTKMLTKKEDAPIGGILL